MSSKRGGNPRREAAWWGRCCTGGRCSRAVQESNGDLLQDDASLTPGVGIGGEAEGEREPRTDVQLGVGTGHTAQHNHTHTQEGGYGKADRNVHHEVGEHHGEGGYARPTGAVRNKRRQHPYGEAVSQGRCCKNGTCSRVGQQSFVHRLQSDVFPPPCEGSWRKTDSKHIHTNTHAQVEEHQGQDDYERPTETGNFFDSFE